MPMPKLETGGRSDKRRKLLKERYLGETEGLIIETTLYGMVAWWCGLQGALIVGTPWAVFIWQSTRLTAATVTFNIFKIFGLKTFLSVLLWPHPLEISQNKLLCSSVVAIFHFNLISLTRPDTWVLLKAIFESNTGPFSETVCCDQILFFNCDLQNIKMLHMCWQNSKPTGMWSDIRREREGGLFWPNSAKIQQNCLSLSIEGWKDK